MNIVIEKLSTIDEVFKNISLFNNCFIESTEERVGDLWEYSKKVLCYGNTYLVKTNNNTVGIIIFYSNDQVSKTAYITMIAVLNEYLGTGIGAKLLRISETHALQIGMEYIKLEVHKENYTAIRFYEKNGFLYFGDASEKTIYLRKELSYATVDKEGDSI